LSRPFPFSIRLAPPLLVAEFASEQRVLSWALSHPGFQTARRVAWLEVRNKDLPESVDPLAHIASLMDEAGLSDAVTLVTSRDIRCHHLAQETVEGWSAACLATVGLSNGERVGTRCAEPVWVPGTINLLVHVSEPLSEAAFVETVSIVAQARTAAVLDAGVVRAGLAVTGTGTDCIAVAAPSTGEGARFAGLHTAVGEAVGRAVYRAMEEGIAVWKKDFAALVVRSAAAE
jgi:adenosylcobinamide amidohydrolase